MAATIQQFSLGFLAYKGALIELQGASAGVLLGRETSSALGINEYERLAFDASAETAGSLRVDYDSPCLEAMGGMVETMGRLACVSNAMAAPLRAIDAVREMEKTLILQNGVYRVRDCAPTSELYFCFLLKYDAMSDERSGGTEELWVNPGTNSLGVHSLFDAMEISDTTAPPETAASAHRAWDLAAANAAAPIRSRLGGMLASLHRRRDRDLRRIRDYYGTIDAEIRAKIQRLASKEDARKVEMDRLAATAAAYESRAAELIERYRMRVRVGLIGAIACPISTYRVDVQLMRRSAKATAYFSWNPWTRRIDRRCCDACRQTVQTAVLCDDRVHYLCSNCLGPCEACSKPFCRACHKHCPRRHAD